MRNDLKSICHFILKIVKFFFILLVFHFNLAFRQKLQLKNIC